MAHGERRLAAAWLLGALMLAGCTGESTRPHTAAAEPAASAAVQAQILPEWSRFVETYQAAEAYYQGYGSRLWPASEERDVQTKVDLAAAVAGIEELALQGCLSEAELALIRLEITELDPWGGRRSRNVILRSGAHRHSDGIAVIPDLAPYFQLRARIPMLRRLVQEERHSRPVLRWLLPRIRTLATATIDPQAHLLPESWAQLKERTTHPSNRPTGEQLQTEVMSLFDQIQNALEIQASGSPGESL